ncbi:1035_t:CDS:1, partial [Dentiscutata heterogama]
DTNQNLLRDSFKIITRGTLASSRITHGEMEACLPNKNVENQHHRDNYQEEDEKSSGQFELDLGVQFEDDKKFSSLFEDEKPNNQFEEVEKPGIQFEDDERSGGLFENEELVNQFENEEYSSLFEDSEKSDSLFEEDEESEDEINNNDFIFEKLANWLPESFENVFSPYFANFTEMSFFIW